MPIRHIILIILLVSSILVLAQKNKELPDLGNQVNTGTDTNSVIKIGPVISFNATSHNIGSVKQDTDLIYEFSFANKGNQPLLVTNVRASCSCTVASFPKTPVQPNQSERIAIKLDTSIPGSFSKVVAVYSNAINDVDTSIDKSRIILNISWTVVEKTKEADED